ncbi:MAG: hypothetical protein RSE00_00785 [Clostridia bacterium]
MSLYSNLPKKNKNELKRDGKTLRKTFAVDDRLYEKLQYLINNVYNTSINKLVNIAIENLVETENISIYEVGYKENNFIRSYLINENLINDLEKLRKKYGISSYRLVNIAIRNALKDEGIDV